jgi:putative drug exporter of the RND superfamily
MDTTLPHTYDSGSIARIARTAYRHRGRVVAGWIGLVVVLSVLSSMVGGEFRNDDSIGGAESERADELLEVGGLGSRGGYSGQIVFGADDGVGAPHVRAAMDGFLADVAAAVPEVRIRSPFDPDADGQVAPDGRVAFAELQFGTIDRDEATALAARIVDVRSRFEPPDGVQVDLGGRLFFERSAFSTEGFGFVMAMVILLIAFGSVLAMSLPIVTALVGIGCGLGLVALAAHWVEIPEFGPQGAMLVSIGVGVDYALLIVTRFRDELRAGRTPEAAVVRSMSTAGRSVLFAGLTVVVALLGLLLSEVAVTRALAIAMAIGVLMVMLASLTLVPALLGFAGHDIDRLSVHRRNGRTGEVRSTVWFRWSRFVQRRPGPIAAVSIVVLVLLALPLLSMRLGFSDAGNRPASDTSRRAYDLLAGSFGPGHNGPLFLAVHLPGDDAEDRGVLARLGSGLRADQGIARVLPATVNDAGDVGVVPVFPTTSPQDDTTVATLNRLRTDIAPHAVAGTAAEVLVGGMPAVAVDLGEVQARQMPIFIGAVLVLSFLLLLVVFRSVLVAFKAVVMNTLSIGAAYGAVVAVFQWGWASDLLGTGEPGPIEAWAPMLLFAVTFGLSIDYEVFLLSRIKEEHEATGETSTAVADGLAKTARLITAAAAIMVFVAGGFVLSDERALQIMGFGLATAILVDAALVRSLLVPAAMELLGDRNWWIPRWLDRLLPHVDIDGSADAGPHRPAPAVSTFSLAAGTHNHEVPCPAHQTP